MNRISKSPMASFLLLAVAIATAGSFYIRHQIAESLKTVQETLTTIADLKATQVSDWHKERLIDAHVLFNNPLFHAQTLKILADPANERTRRDLIERLDVIQKFYGYRQVVLYDSVGAPRLWTPHDIAAPDIAADKDFRVALSAKEIVAGDLQRDQHGIHLNIWVPLGGRFGNDGPARGVLLLQIDPYHYLYPLIKTWPTPSRSAEMILLRREGNEVVFLNELRHRKDPVLSLRLPIKDYPNMVAAMAVTGRNCVLECVDYRQVPVLAAMRNIPGTSWFIVAKVDREEIYAPLHEHAWAHVFIVFILIFASALGMRLLGRERDARQLREQAAFDQERQELAERILHLNKHANDIILLTDEQWRIQEANDRAIEAYGYSPDELLQLSLRVLRAPETLADFDQRTTQAGGPDGVVYETVHRRKDGSTFPVEASVRTVTVGGKRYHQGIIRDITERKQAEAELLETNQELQTLNRIISNYSSSLELTATLDKILDESLQLSGLEGGTVCLLTPDNFLEIAAQRETSEATIHELTTHQIKIGDCLCGTCARDLCPLILRDETAVRNFPTREYLRNEGIRFHAAFPLVSSGKCVGVLCIFTRTDRKPSERSLKLLKTMTSQMAMMVENASLYEERQKYTANLEMHVRHRTAELEQKSAELGENQTTLMNLVADLNLKTEELEKSRVELEKQNEKLRETYRGLEMESAGRIQMMEELRNKDRMLIQQSRMAAMGEMLGNIAHQWRQPLNVLGLKVQEIGLSYDLGGFSKELLDDNIAKIMELLQHMSQTIDDFRNFTAPDKEKCLFMVDQVILKTVSLIKDNFTELGITIEFSSNGGPQINGYPNEYGQVLLNILTNAKDAFGEQRTIDARITVRSWTEDGRAVVTIIDNAGGVGEEIMDKIFDAYFTTKEQGKGTGVGLFMSKNIIEKNMGGRFTVRNIDGGAEFKIEV